jgi:hypothetical protein
LKVCNCEIVRKGSSSGAENVNQNEVDGCWRGKCRHGDKFLVFICCNGEQQVTAYGIVIKRVDATRL